MAQILPTQTELKQQAKRLRAHLMDQGKPLSHSAALETLANQHGYRDWNALSAAAGSDVAVPNERNDLSKHFQVGRRVVGAYMGQLFAGEVLGVQALANEQYRLTVLFDEPVDVVEFDSFSAFRKRVTVVVARDGVSPQKRSDGTPFMRIDGG